MKSVDENSSIYIKNNREGPKSKVGDHVKTSKSYVPNWSEEVFVIKKVKDTYRGHVLLLILTVKILLERYMKKTYKKQITVFSIEKVWREKVINYMSNWKVIIIHLIVGMIKNILYKNELFFFLC